jgi:hypothetical protein
MESQMTKLNYNLIAGVGGWVIIYTTVIASAGFYFGKDYADKQTATIHAAVKAAIATPAPLATVPKQ